ncbi:MAG: HlyD family efflux transporter periplasmic adaptor subunit [Candidatus Cloacimonetes bacterium]|nr:HlyD family efflux transporter periplasmic adaptor subunit [Candidatus Cloacimonadota bacterium]
MKIVLWLLLCVYSYAQGRSPFMVVFKEDIQVYRASAVVSPWQESTLSAQIRAEVIHRFAEPGQIVETQALLLEQDPREVTLQKEQILSEINRLNVLLDQANQRLKRREDHAIAYSPEEVEAENATVLNLKSQIRTQSVLLARTELDLSRLKIVAPYPGQITEVMVQKGDLASPGQALLQIMGTDLFRISASVPHRIFKQLRLNQSVSIMGASGIISALIPKSRESSMPEVQIRVSNSREFFSGMRLTVEIPFTESLCPVPSDYIQKENRGMSVRMQNSSGKIINLMIEGEHRQEWFYPMRCEPLLGHKVL